MKFEEVYGRTHRGGLSQAEAAEVLGVSERTFRRWRDRYEAEGADGLYDRRLGRVSARRAPVDEVARVLALFDTRYWDFGEHQGELDGIDLVGIVCRPFVLPGHDAAPTLSRDP